MNELSEASLKSLQMNLKLKEAYKKALFNLKGGGVLWEMFGNINNLY